MLKKKMTCSCISRTGGGSCMTGVGPGRGGAWRLRSILPPGLGEVCRQVLGSRDRDHEAPLCPPPLPVGAAYTAGGAAQDPVRCLRLLLWAPSSHHGLCHYPGEAWNHTAYPLPSSPLSLVDSGSLKGGLPPLARQTQPTLWPQYSLGCSSLHLLSAGQLLSTLPGSRRL